MPQATTSTLPPAILQADNLPSMPTVAVEVLRQTQDEDSTIDDLANTLSMDPALAVKLLKLSNSSLFSLGSEVTTMQRACMVLGLKTVKLMSLSFSLVSAIRENEVPGEYDLEQFWNRSIVCAVAARSLGQAFGSNLQDEGFLCGLLSRIGQLVLATCLPEDYAAVIAASKGWPKAETEAQKLGFDSADVGGALLRHWELPELIADTVSQMHSGTVTSKDPSPQLRELVSIMHVAGLCEELICGDDKGAAKQRLDQQAEKLYKLTPTEVDEFLIGLQESVAETANMLNIDMGGSVNVSEVLAQAQAQLVQLTLGVATDMRRVERRADRLETSNRELRNQAHTDKLTNLPNRASFDEILEKCVSERLAENTQHALGLLMIDVDHFKNFNDTYGHQVGDEVLRVVGKVLGEATRESDVPARYGGEEFAVILPRTTSIGLKSLAERVRAAIESAQIVADGKTLSVTASVGGACVTKITDPKAGSKLIKIADHYLYKAKESGRNRCEFFPKTVLPTTG